MGYIPESFSKRKKKKKENGLEISLVVCLSGMLESLGFISSTAKISHGGTQWRQEDSKFKVILAI